MRIAPLLILLPALAAADWTESLGEQSKRAWEATRSAGEQAWDATREAGTDVYDRARQMVGGESEPAPPADPLELRLSRVWAETLDKLGEGGEVLKQMRDAPESSWLRTDRDDLNAELEAILEELSQILADGAVREVRETIWEHKATIAELNAAIARYNELAMAAPASGAIATTRAEYAEKVDDAKARIDDHERAIAELKGVLRERLAANGLELTPDELETLLIRVDGDDLMQMAEVFAVLKKIVGRLAALVEQSGEDLQQARRYYGMHVVALKLAVYMQETYMQRVESDYLPRLKTIVERAEALRHEARRAQAQENDARLQGIYANNIAAQTLTRDAAELYRDRLADQVHRVGQAKRRSASDLKAAQNTFETVSLSGDLMAMIRQDESAFQAVMQLQLPEIRPFENTRMQRRFEELTMELRR